MEKYIIALLKIRGLGNVKVLKYILQCNKDENTIINSLSNILSKEELFIFQTYLDEAEYEINMNNEKGIKLISLFDENYPPKLLELKDPVLYLYYFGNIKLFNNTCISVIGSRKINEEYKKIAFEVANRISKANITVISGLALGTDTYAHLGSHNEIGSTIAVLPSGIDIITPSSNRELAKKIVNNNGLIVSEYSAGTHSSSFTFVKRDRIQAALSNAVVVIKGDEKSGTMNAVKVAQSMNIFVTQFEENKNSLIENNFNLDENSIKNIIDVAFSNKE